MDALGSSFKSLRHYIDQNPKALTFPSGWGKGPVFEDWYNKLIPDPNATSIQRLEIRKDTSGAFPHRFIIVQMCDGKIHRFDRRPDKEETGPAVLANVAVKSKDEYIADVTGPAWLQFQTVSHCEIELLLEGRADLLAVLSACYGISLDQTAHEYTLLTHNCFFFSWTILMVVSRHCLPHKVPSHDPVAQRFGKRLDDLTSTIVEDAVELFLEMVIDTTTVFRGKIRAILFKGLGILTTAAWSLPIGALRFMWRRLFGLRLHLGLRKQLNQAVRLQLESRLIPACTEAMAHLPLESLDNHLWIKDLDDTVKASLETEISKILWDVVLDAIAGGCGDTSPEQITKLTNPDLKYAFLVRNAAQFCSVWNAVLHRALPAARDAAYGQSFEEGRRLSHAEMFDKAWAAAKIEAFQTAQTVVRNTRDQVGHFEARDMMWGAIWEVWDDAWGCARENAQKRAIAVVERVVDQLLVIGAGVLREEMRNSGEQFVEARLYEAKKRWWQSRFSSVKMTNVALQDHMQKSIKENTVSHAALQEVDSTMSRIWMQARGCLHVPTPTALEVPACVAEIVDVPVSSS
ncbi:hypothetical protein BDV93DRAFT_89280 [Ceratobasidium sp. AG-I]|nr:hypothetical protein BDV93DRAFT_89280 [Ceratobasidium sp. AG-I]